MDTPSIEIIFFIFLSFCSRTALLHFEKRILHFSYLLIVLFGRFVIFRIKYFNALNWTNENGNFFVELKKINKKITLNRINITIEGNLNVTFFGTCFLLEPILVLHNNKRRKEWNEIHRCCEIKCRYTYTCIATRMIFKTSASSFMFYSYFLFPLNTEGFTRLNLKPSSLNMFHLLI